MHSEETTKARLRVLKLGTLRVLRKVRDQFVTLQLHFRECWKPEVDGISSAVEIALEVSPVECRERTLTTGMPWRSLVAAAMKVDAQTSVARL